MLSKKQIELIKEAAQAILEEVSSENPVEDTVTDYAHDIVHIVVGEEDEEVS